MLVHEQHRRHGEGRNILIASLEEMFLNEACTSVELDVKDTTGAMRKIVDNLPRSLMCDTNRDDSDMWYIEPSHVS